jgi:hypothetical protein
LTGLRVPEEGVDAKAGKTSTVDIASRNIILSFEFEGIVQSGSNADKFGHKAASPSEFLMARKVR